MQVRLAPVSLPEGLWKLSMGNLPDREFRTNGGLFAAMDIASDYANIAARGGFGPSLRWTHVKSEDCYTAEVLT